jgi:hypothetical protein
MAPEAHYDAFRRVPVRQVPVRAAATSSRSAWRTRAVSEVLLLGRRGTAGHDECQCARWAGARAEECDEQTTE